LPNLNPSGSLELGFPGLLFPRIYGRHQFPPFQALAEKLSKGCHFLKKTIQVEIIITISTAILIKKTSLMSYIRGIFEKMMSFTQPLNQDLEQGKLMVAVNSLQKT